ncbi:inhibitor of Bruton tyrosine kinase, partial [Halyomorpha halys]|uniref:inhibitor of Bruton tyrosine kinase n=1 Tax=Halyomorpha halys TaxID=286706 RepID=UPI0006D4E0FB
MSKQLHNGKHKKYCDEHEVEYINGAITKRGVSDRQLAAYFQENYIFQDIGKLHDAVGRTPLHMAASCGRSELCEWLIFAAGANINSRDWESGYTPLQRALFHGHIRTAVRLMQIGADLTSLDREGLNAVGIVTKDRPINVEIKTDLPCQVYIWGSNDNYTLGTGTNNSRKLPDLLDNFKRRNVSITQVCMEEFHSIFVSKCNRIWVCGNGQGGRLGISSKNHCLTPSLLLSNNECKMVAIALNHTLVLLSSSSVLACGQNEHYQLGLSPYVKETTTLKPVSIKGVEDLEGICAGKYHSVFYTKMSIYVCGLNGGQLGLSANQNNVPFVKVPTQVPINLKSNSTITSVSSSSTCVAFSVSSGSIYILYQFMFKKIASKQLDVKQIGTIGGSLSSDIVTENTGSLKVVLLTLGGCILIWQESLPQLTRCMFGLSRLITISSIFLNERQILFTSRDGEAFSGTIGQIEKQTVNTSKEEKKSGFHKFLAKSECYHIQTKRIPNVHRAVAITSDPKGKNFAVIQVNPHHALTEVPVQSEDQIINQYLQLLDEASEEDPLHDVTFKVKNTLFPAHKYIVECANSTLLNFPVDNGYIIINDVLPVIFKEIMTFIYTGRSDLLKIGPVSLKHSNCSDDPLKLLLDASNKFKLTSLYKKVVQFKYEDGCVSLKKLSVMPNFCPPKFSRESYPELYDVVVKSDDGKFIKAHKCILAARLEYFHHMLLGGWTESSNTPVLHIDCPLKSLEVLLDFIYTNEIPLTVATESFENIGKLLIVSDQLICNDLKEICEISLVNVLNLKNAATMLQISFVYNAPQLKRTVMQFISLNLDTLIENRVLDILNDEILLELDEYYRNFNSVSYCKRIITPYSEYTVSDETILSSPEIAWPVERTEKKDNVPEIKNKDTKERQQKPSLVTPKKKTTPPKKT